MDDNYPKAYREVYEILKYVPKEDLLKIPKDLIETIRYNMDKNYSYEIDGNIEFQVQPMLKETKAILAVLYRDYWADEIQKVKIIEKQKQDIQREEETKKEKYNYEKLFESKRQLQYQKIKGLTIYQKETWYMKFINFMKKIFGKKYKNS